MAADLYSRGGRRRDAMKLFSESNTYVQVLLLISLLALYVLQLYLQSLLASYGSRKKLCFNVISLLLTSLLSIILIWERNDAEVFLPPFSLSAAVILIILLYLFTVAAIIWEKRDHLNMLTAYSVRDAYDHIPFGLCFFSENELPVLCNRQMSRITFELIGKDMQSFGELERALEQPANGAALLIYEGSRVYRLSDGREWYFDKTEIRDKIGNRYIQVTAADHTELNRLNAELQLRNKELKKMMKRLDRIRINIAETIREQELLTAKMRLHNKMGNCMLSARQYLMQDCPRENKEELIKHWRKTADDLLDEVGRTDENAPGEELMRIAKDFGIEIVIRGSFPDDPDIAYLFVTALRECLTNAIHHASASRLELAFTDGDGTVTGVFTNDGKAPEREITEGGGLTGLRIKIEKAGGAVTICSLPAFSLTITLPDRFLSDEDEDNDECTDS